MKLLLTSSGLSKRAIGERLQQMAGKAPSDCKVVFIPTAANVETYAKDWLIAQFGQLQRYGFATIDIVDIAADGVDWRARMADADILWVSGGNTFYLLQQVRRAGFDTWLKTHGRGKVYVGGSASSILMTPTIAIAEGVDENTVGLTDLKALAYVPFEINVHCDAAGLEATAAYAAHSPYDVYALDDLSAIAVENGTIEVISGGSWRHFPKHV